MAKNAVTGCFSSPLDGLLGTRAKLGVLRVIAGAPLPLGLREVSRRSGMAYRSIELAIKDLVSLGLLERIDGSRERLVRLSSSHRLAPTVLALLRAEEDFRPALRSELQVLAEAGGRDGLLAVAIIGAGARGAERIGEALELLLLTRDPASATKWRLHFERAGIDIAHRFGTQLAVVAYDLEQAKRMWQTRTPAAERTIREAEALWGESVESLLELGTNQ
jgi:hypothetical protein